MPFHEIAAAMAATLLATAAPGGTQPKSARTCAPPGASQAQACPTIPPAGRHLQRKGVRNGADPGRYRQPRRETAGPLETPTTPQR